MFLIRIVGDNVCADPCKILVFYLYQKLNSSESLVICDYENTDIDSQSIVYLAVSR